MQPPQAAMADAVLDRLVNMDAAGQLANRAVAGRTAVAGSQAGERAGTPR